MTGNWRLATGDWQPATGNWQLATGNWQPATGNWQLATGNWQLATGNWSSAHTIGVVANLIDTATDERHLMRSIELAERARGRTSPNPLVGAVIVKDGRVLGEGWHQAAGLPHAEREALAACTEDPAGATMYVSRLISTSVVLGLGPVLAALMIAGRVGSGIASEIASMKVTEQIDALRAEGTDPIQKLARPGWWLACS